MGEIRDKLEEELGPRSVGTADVDGRSIPLAFASDEAQVVMLLQLAGMMGWSVLPIGSGTKLARGPLRDKPRFALSVRGLSGVTAYERGDGTISARAGSTMAALQQVARSGGNHLTPDVARPGEATLGGTLAAGASGVDRLRHGPVRHHVLGMRVALADGTITKTGGRLVKNVTGYDLHRLYTGSRGALCVILEASLRLFPAPEREVVLSATYHVRAAALAAALQVLATSARPTCVCVAGRSGCEWTLTVALAGRAEPVGWEKGAVEAIIGTCTVTEGAAARAAVESVRDRETDATLRAGTLPADFAGTLERLDALLAVRRDSAGLVLHPGVGTLDVTLDAGGDDASRTETVLSIARALSDAGAQVELRDVALEARAAWDPLAQLPAPAREIMSRLKSAFDPASRFAGAFGGSPSRPSGAVRA